MTQTPIAELPKAVLHDHLDGGLRVGTLIELAAAANYELPATDPESLAGMMYQGDSGSLVEYLRAFDHTTGVMQTAEAIERVAYEAAIDHHKNGVVYAEIRMAPSLLTMGGLSRVDVLAAILEGLRRASAGTDLITGLIATAMRSDTDSLEVAVAAARFVGDGLIGFDLAGPEVGNPVDAHLPAIRYAREAGLGITLHAGEAGGLDSIAAALGKGAAQRIGHGVRIIDDCKVAEGEIVDTGLLAARIRDQQIPLECAVTSNIHTGIADDVASHPFGMLYRAGFNVTINTDNRLMSRVTMSSEFGALVEHAGLSIADLGTITAQTLRAGFTDWPARRAAIESLPSSYGVTG